MSNKDIQKRIGFTLHQGFNWGDSSEGYNFWRQVHGVLGDHWSQSALDELELGWRTDDPEAQRKTLQAVLALYPAYVRDGATPLDKLIYEYLWLKVDALANIA